LLLLGSAVQIGQALSAGAPAASAQSTRPQVDVIEVSGRIDPIVADFVKDAVRAAERARSEVLVIQLDSPGSLLSTRDLGRLTARVRTARVSVAVWIGPSGAEAKGGALALVRAADIKGMSPGSALGPLSSSQAVARKAVDNLAPTLGDFIVDLDGRTVGNRQLSTARVVERGGQPRREPSAQVRFAKLALIPRLMHTVAGPSVAYLLLIAGLLLIVFEFFTVGIGLAGAAGAAFLVLSAYGLAVLPTRPLGLALVGLGIFGFAVDVQTGAPRFWTVTGAVSLVAGTFLLYDGLSLPFVPALLVLVGAVLFMLAAMPSVVRARFSTPTIGRESMVGETGRATAALDPDGMVRVRHALWRARTNRATPIAAGEPVRVVGVEGLVLQVEPARAEMPDSGSAGA
jgi:membrane-bound serine protease (ClpP class)